MNCSCVAGLSVWLFGCSILCGVQDGTHSEKLDWLTGSGDSLTFHMRGVVVDESGNRIPNARIDLELHSPLGKEKQEVPVTGDGKFAFSIPCNRNLWTFRVSGSTDDGTRTGAQTIPGRDFRRVARDGLTLTLLNRVNGSGIRTVAVTVVDENGPVPDASVNVTTLGELEFADVTNELGVATLSVPVGDKLRRIAAWQGDQRIGGFDFGRNPARDPEQDFHTVELYRPRAIKVRLVDEQGQPVANIPFELSAGTAPPDYNFIGQPENSILTTDSNGEAVAGWFPAVENPFYWIHLKTDEWLERDSRRAPIKDNQIEIVLRKSRKGERRTVHGRVEFAGGSPAGFQVTARSFQGEVERRSDSQVAFTDANGNFALSVLPGATYCYYIDDSEWISASRDDLLFDPDSGEAAKPVLTVIKGQRVEVLATQGSEKRPMPGINVSLHSIHPYSWMEDGKPQHGQGGRSWQVTTDANGKVTTFATPGSLRATVYTTDWNTQQTVEVTPDKTAEVRVHRDIAEAFRLSGNLTAPEGASLDGASVYVAALDGNTQGQQTVFADAQGAFQCDVKSAKVGVFVRTDNGKYSATRIVDVPLPGKLELNLEPTTGYLGQLLDDKGEPIADALVRARVELDLGFAPDIQNLRLLRGNTIETMTDKEGRYVLSGIPVGIRFVLEWQPRDGSSTATRIGERFVTSGEKRPLDVFRVGGSASKQAFDEVMDNYMADCRNYGIHALIAVFSDEQSRDWANEILNAYDENRAILGYLPAMIDTSKTDEREARMNFVHSLDLTAPDSGHVTLCVLSGDGKQIGRLDLECSDPDAAVLAHDFIREHEPAAGDALQKLNAALSEARSTGRVVWVQHSQTRCGPCFRLSRWIEEHRAVLEKQFVFVKIDDVREANGIEVAKRVTGDRQFGIPFVAIMDPSGNVVMDWEGPLGNIGFPSSFEGSQHLRKLISETGDQISDEELDALIDSLLEK